MIRAFFFSLLLLTGCTKDEHTITIAATPVPHGELLEVIKPDLKEQGITLKIIEIDDYHLPNRLLREGKVDANFFQHEPFLDLQCKEFGYGFTTLAKVHIEPLGIYSAKLSSLEAIPEGGTVAIPSDPTNEARALDLLQNVELITLKEDPTDLATTLDIKENPKKLIFREVDAALLPRVLADVDIAVIPANFALQGQLMPHDDALALESLNSPYVNLVVIRCGEESRPELVALAEALQSEKLRTYIQQKYRGAIEPAF